MAERTVRDAAVEAVVDEIPPNTWDACVWVGSNYVTGRIDGADVRRIVDVILAAADRALAALGGTEAT